MIAKSSQSAKAMATQAATRVEMPVVLLETMPVVLPQPLPPLQQLLPPLEATTVETVVETVAMTPVHPQLPLLEATMEATVAMTPVHPRLTLPRQLLLPQPEATLVATVATTPVPLQQPQPQPHKRLLQLLPPPLDVVVADSEVAEAATAGDDSLHETSSHKLVATSHRQWD